ncbi:polyprenyl synthetase family protein [Leeia sp.]|uniref:polyprenyl synthetase family protein n=1 Tax=Leeia sp. TaxID=2884678 RepID=UPI0035AE9E38
MTPAEYRNASFEVWAHYSQQLIEQALTQLLPARDTLPQRLHEAMRYATLGGGKRVRPLLCLAAGQLVNASEGAILPVASALECIHAYSLVHDDLPCMDDDVLRRGKPTCHVQFDEATALLAGDALQTQAFELLADAPLSPDQRIALVKELAHASGSLGMAGGQAIDLQHVGQHMELPELELMHIMKTGALIHAAVRMGSLCHADKSAALPDTARQSLDHYARAIGLAFQVVDDILDVEADSATLGKTAGKDAAADKPTYVSLLGLAEAKRMAAALHQQAHDALASFGDAGRRLRELADFIVLRHH